MTDLDTGHRINAAPSNMIPATVPAPAIPAHPQHARSHERRTKIFEYLWQLADDGAPMVSNNQLARVCGASGSSPMTDALVALSQAGLIVVEYGEGGRRRVAICATGRKTDWQKPQEWWGWEKGRKPGKKPTVAKGGKALLDRPVTRWTKPSAIAYGLSDSALYGHLADAVRECRRRGDVVYRDERDKTCILINGRAGDVAARAAWWRGRSRL